MGGAGGHMWHPFDCPDVNSGQDLVDFFKKSIDAIRRNPAALKIDGVNLSFRLKANRAAPSGFEFVIDRGSMKPLDVEGVTADNADQRFITKDGSPHGMVEATRILLSIFNAAVPEILPELEELGMTQNMGPYSLYFNTEFVLKKINVKEYPFNFIAIHGVNKFEQKGPRSRKGVGTEADQSILDRIKDKVESYANERDFKVFTKIPATVNKSVVLEDALNQEFTIVYKNFARDEEEPGEMGAGEGSTKPLKVWLADVAENPINKIVNISDQMRQIHPQMGRKQSPYAKNIYLEILKGVAVSDIAAGPEDVEPLVDGVVVMHATRILGNAVLDALESEEFGSARGQEGVVVKDPEICGGTPFKFTGDFIVGGLATTFREAKYRKGELLKEFVIHEEEGEEEETQNEDKFVIMIPGGFKPPTAGHYHLIKYYDKRPDVHKILVVTGPKPREGVTLQQSKEIFNVYGGFSDKVDFVTSDDPTPLRTCYELVQDENFINQFPNMKFAIGAGDKGNDPKRVEGFVKYFLKNDDLKTRISWYPPAKSLEIGGQPASASRMRKAFQQGNWEEFKNLLPDDNFYDDVVQVLNNQDANDAARTSMVAENFLLAVPQSFLVEKKSLQKRRSDKIAHLIGTEGKPRDQAVAMAYNMVKEQEEQESEQEKKNRLVQTLKGVIANLVPEFIKSLPSLQQADVEQDIVEPITNIISGHLIKTELTKTQKPEELAQGSETGQVDLPEASGMAAGAGAFGAVQGYSGPQAFTGEYEDE